MYCITVFVLIIYSLSNCNADPADLIKDLPGLDKKDDTFKQYSGFLDVGDRKHYHYWFVESESNPAKDPVILWLNGGPGASSLEGFWTENGPFRVASDHKTLVKQPYSWNKIANVLYLESPAGVGHSYQENQTTKFMVYNDSLTAEENHLALEQFFKKFPQFTKNPFYMTGESYAGVYIPTLAVKIYESNSTINLKGVAIGNGALDFNMMDRSIVEIGYGHGLMDSIMYNNLTEHCCTCTSNGRVCNFVNNTLKMCRVYGTVLGLAQDNHINPYNIYADCNPHGLYERNSRFTKDMKTFFGIEFEEIQEKYEKYSSNPDCSAWTIDYVYYMRRNDTREALHIPDHLPLWGLENPIDYRFKAGTMKAQVKEMIEKYKIPTFIVYNGDIDIVCDFMSGQLFVDDLGYKLIDKYKKWTVGGRTAGFVKRYEGITFMTIRDAGHLVPTDQPEAALAMIKELIGLSKVA